MDVLGTRARDVEDGARDELDPQVVAVEVAVGVGVTAKLGELVVGHDVCLQGSWNFSAPCLGMSHEVIDATYITP